MIFDVEDVKDKTNKQATEFKSSTEALKYAKKQGWKRIKISVR